MLHFYLGCEKVNMALGFGFAIKANIMTVDHKKEKKIQEKEQKGCENETNVVASS